jgi:hypothetical protein
LCNLLSIDKNKSAWPKGPGTPKQMDERILFHLSAAWQSCPVERAGLSFRHAAQEVDPWLCVPAFRRVCLYRLLTVKLYYSNEIEIFTLHSAYRITALNGEIG